MKTDSTEETNRPHPDPCDIGRFAVPTYEAWKAAAEAALKGGTVEEKLVGRTLEQIFIQPIYPFVHGAPPLQDPGVFPFRRGTSPGVGWRIGQSYMCADAAAYNAILREEMTHGLSCLVLRPHSVDGAMPRIRTHADLSTLLEGVSLRDVSLWIDGGTHTASFSSLLEEHMRIAAVPPEALQGCVGMSIFSELVTGGTLPSGIDSALDELAAFTRRAEESFPRLKTVMVQSCPYHNGGADAVDEIALVLSECATFIEGLMARGIDATRAAGAIAVQMSTGTSFFMEIAKLRVMRMLFAGLARAFGATEQSQRLMIHSRTARMTQTLYEPTVNILRTATAAFSAVLGGADSIEITPFDSLSAPENAFSRRIARNIHLLLREECGMARVVDPIGGSRMLESLTDSLAAGAWKRFQAIESEGGLFAALSRGTPQKRIRAVLEKRTARAANRRDVIVGTNMYPEVGEGRLPLPIVVVAPPSPENSVSVDPIRPVRVSSGFEEVRQRIAALQTPPRVFLARFISKEAHRLRAGFARGFFSACGVSTIESPETADAVDLLGTCAASQADVVVLCSSDDAYPSLVESICAPLKQRVAGVRILIAGNPGDKETHYRALGVDDFIHLGTVIPEKIQRLFADREVQP